MLRGAAVDILQSLLDSSSHAIFTVDRSGTVTHINRRAKERFGLFNHNRYSHGAGSLEKGDLVILATTAMGRDDGNLTAGDLRCLGIHESKLRQGDMLIAVGVYGEEGVKPVYKYLRGGSGDSMHFATVFQGISIQVTIENKVVTVSVDGKEYAIGYFICIGQMVVLSRRNRRVKFWEEKGYSARKEGIGELLRRGRFAAKVKGSEVTVVGYHFPEFFEGEKFRQHLQEVLEGSAQSYEAQEYEINGYALSASILPIHGEDGGISGAIVRFRNIEDIRTTIMERNRAIAAAERQYREAEKAISGDEGFLGLFGSSTAMANVMRSIRKLANLDCPILIQGESGTGKTAATHRIAEQCPREGQFITVDCAGVSQEQLSEELFGLQGAAMRAEGGFLLLEEVSCLNVQQQGKLLHLMQYQEVCLPNGDIRPCRVRVMATTVQDLRKMMQEGSFRADLYYYLNAFSVTLPALRDCKEALPFLVSNLMDQLREKYRLYEKNLSGEAFGRLIVYHWPGNIRELERVLERAVVLSDTDIIYPEHVQLEQSPVSTTLREQLQYLEKQIIRNTLTQCGGDRKKAQELLGLSRSVFYSKMKEYGIR